MRFKRNQFGADLAAGRRVRVIHMGKELADTSDFSAVPESAALHCVIVNSATPPPPSQPQHRQAASTEDSFNPERFASNPMDSMGLDCWCLSRWMMKMAVGNY